MRDKRETVALFGNMYQTKKSKYAGEVISGLRKLGYNIIVEEGLRQSQNVFMDAIPEEDAFVGRDFEADFAISLGGDGTFLRTAMFVGPKNIPILGINFGHLGFMSEVNPEDIHTVLKDVRDGNYKIVTRSVLELVTDDEEQNRIECPYALNEIAVLKHDLSSMIKIRMSAGGEYLTTYSADGLIIATPTGSTGYALSAGGPVLTPSLHAIVAAAVAPHSLSIRPVVLRDDIEIKLRVISRTKHFLVSIDGRSLQMTDENTLTIRRAPYSVRTIHTGPKTFYDTLREKLRWDGDLQKENEF